MVNYRREMSFGYVQSYPLPTPSMVRGMVHALIGANEYHPMKISIQGKFNSVVTNMQRVYKFDRDRKARPDNPYNVEVGSSVKTAKHGLMFVDQLVDVALVLHIFFENEKLNHELYKSINSSILVLGRNEDIARVDECKVIQLSKCTDEIKNINNIYIPENICKQNQHVETVYRLPFKYADVMSFEDKRIFEFVDVRYVNKGSYIESDDLFLDDEQNPVAFLGINDD